MAHEYSYLLLYGHETWYLSLKCLRIRCYIEYMDLSERMKKSPGKHLHELFSSLLMGDQIREDKNGRICVINGAYEKCKENFYWKIRRKSFGIPMHT